MTLATGLMVYGIIWWLVFFVALPVGNRTAEEVGEEVVKGNVESAPVKPRLLLKAVATTIAAGALWAALYAVIEYDLLNFREYLRR